MRRPVARRPTQGIALFPFLAVLICTMGSLIVLLVLVVNGAQASARAKAAKAVMSSEDLAALQREREDLQWRSEMLEEQRAQCEKKLQDKRLELAHLEDHIRRLQDQAKQLESQAKSLQNAGKDNLLNDEFAREQLESLQEQLAEKKAELDAAKKKLATKRPAYAIIPYDGPNGTSRRPIYIECREDGVYIQPEGFKLTVQDFQGPLGPGNPLDAALRAVREHYAKLGMSGEPYPLIIVRPNGTVAFGACRAAMKHWENEFGYELVDEDAQLKFPNPDASLADTLQRTVRDARVRQSALAAAMPNRFSGETRLASFRPADNQSSDSLGPPGGTGGVGQGRGSAGGVGFSGAPGAGVGSGGVGPNTGMNGMAGTGGSTGMMGGPMNNGGAPGFAGTGQYAANGLPSNGLRSGTGMSGNGTGSGMGMGSGSNGGGGGLGMASYNGNMSGSGSGGSTGTGGSGGGGYGNAPGGPNGATGTGSGNATGNATAGGGVQGGTSLSGSSNGRPGGTSGGSGMSGGGSTSGGGSMASQSGGGMSGSSSGLASSSSSSGGTAGGTNASGGMQSSSASSSGMSGSGGGASSSMMSSQQSPAVNMNMNAGDAQQRSRLAKAKKAAQRREENWGLPDTTKKATAISRPIYLECYADKLVILPEKGENHVPLVIPVDEGVNAQMEVLLTTTWQIMDRWGLAIFNGYWKPVLTVAVKPGADARFAELQQALQGSGLEVERKLR